MHWGNRPQLRVPMRRRQSRRRICEAIVSKQVTVQQIMTVRYIFLCPRCKHQGHTSTMTRTIDYDYSQSNRNWTDDVICPWCDCPTWAVHVEATIGDVLTECNVNCVRAIGATCVCQCGGANHGAAWLDNDPQGERENESDK